MSDLTADDFTEPYAKCWTNAQCTRGALHEGPCDEERLAQIREMDEWEILDLLDRTAAAVSSAVRVALEEVRAIHVREFAGAEPDEGQNSGAYCAHCSDLKQDYVNWPCPTIATITIKTSCAICGDPTHSTERHEETLDADFRVRVAVDAERRAIIAEIEKGGGAVWECATCGKRSHAKRRPTMHERKVYDEPVDPSIVIREEPGGEIFTSVDTSEEWPDTWWIRCGPFESVATRIVAARLAEQ